MAERSKPGSPANRSKSGSPADLRVAHQNTIEADVDPALDDRGDDVDDGYETDMRSNATTSISSSVRDYVFENNRRYHKFQEGRYLLPNDEPEQEREDMKHAMVVNLCNSMLHLAPLQDPQRILDIGTGTGIWAMDVADEHPGAEVFGIDLSPIQPGWVPPNVKFLVDDAEAEWLYEPDSYDLVHARHMCMAIKDWPRLISQAYRTLKPGGWMELQELRFVVQCDDGTLPPDYGYGQFVDHCMTGFKSFGINPLEMEKNSALLQDGGFVNVEERIWKVPIGTWPRDPKMKTVGLYNRSMLIDALHGVSMAPLTRGLKWAPAEVEVFLAGVRKSLMNASIHTYLTFHIVIGQKPV